uniref:Uncharacterized protein n=1 Tax=Arion vulgaris TaxID=1028688 RepID=A0A0B7B965_9EUPU
MFICNETTNNCCNKSNVVCKRRDKLLILNTQSPTANTHKTLTADSTENNNLSIYNKILLVQPLHAQSEVSSVCIV